MKGLISSVTNLWKYAGCNIRSGGLVQGVQQTMQQIQNMSSEVDNAKKARWSKNETTLFDKIIAKEIPADIIYEDEKFLAFNDVNPQAPTHFLVIPKKRIPLLDESKDSDVELLGSLMLTAKKLAKDRLPGGYRLVINNGVHGCQSIYHLHVHILGGRQLGWPPG